MTITWAQYLEQRYASRGTHRVYSSPVRAFVSWAHERGVDPLTAPVAVVAEYFAGLQDRGCSNGHVVVCAAALRALRDYARDILGIERPLEVPAHIGRRGGTRPMPRTLSEEDFRAYQTAAAKIAGEPERTIVLLAPYCGLRIGEWSSLTMDDLEQRGQHDGQPLYVLRVVGKGQKERLAPVFSGASQLLRHYLTAVRPRLGRSRHLFPAGGGRAVSIDALRAAWRHVRPALQMRDFRPHICRSTYATSLLDLGIPIHEVARYLGHSSIQTTFACYAATGRGLKLGAIARPWRMEHDRHE